MVNRDGLFRKGRNFHKVVIIGDGFALGQGDSIVMFSTAGVPRFLQNLTAVYKNIRTHWSFLNRGKYNSTTYDWVPEGKLYKNVFGPGTEGETAECVILMMGTIDVIDNRLGFPINAMNKSYTDEFVEADLSDSMKNIRSICEDLQKKGKRVIICDMPSTGDRINRNLAMVKRFNRQLRWYSAKKKSTDNPVPLVQSSIAKICRGANRAYDAIHFNKSGYKTFAEEIFEQLKNQMISVEYNVVKDIMAGNVAKDEKTKKTD